MTEEVKKQEDPEKKETKKGEKESAPKEVS